MLDKATQGKFYSYNSFSASDLPFAFSNGSLASSTLIFGCVFIAPAVFLVAILFFIPHIQTGCGFM